MSAGPRVTLRDAARRLGVTSAHVRSLLTAGELPGCWGRDDKGRLTAYVDSDAVEKLAARMQRMTP